MLQYSTKQDMDLLRAVWLHFSQEFLFTAKFCACRQNCLVLNTDPCSLGCSEPHLASNAPFLTATAPESLRALHQSWLCLPQQREKQNHSRDAPHRVSRASTLLPGLAASRGTALHPQGCPPQLSPPHPSRMLQVGCFGSEASHRQQGQLHPQPYKQLCWHPPVFGTHSHGSCTCVGIHE